MSLTTIDSQDWEPPENTKEGLRKRYFSPKQYNNVRRVFIKRYWKKSIKDAGSKFTAMFDKMHGELTPIPDLTIGDDLDKQRANDIANRSDDAHDKAVEAHNVNGEAMTHEQAIAHIDAQRRFQK